MTTQRRTQVRVRLAAATLAIGLSFAVAGCGGDNGDKEADKADPKASNTQGADVSTSSSKPKEEPAPAQTLAEVKGEKGVVLAITEATRDAGGFVTVKGEITNTGDEIFDATQWVGTEQEVQKSGYSVAGAVLVDPEAKKRYYVLRDTEGMCLCTMQLSDVKPDETRPIYAQFPAPAEDVTDVEFQLPTMPPAKIKISG